MALLLEERQPREALELAVQHAERAGFRPLSAARLLDLRAAPSQEGREPAAARPAAADARRRDSIALGEAQRVVQHRDVLGLDLVVADLDREVGRDAAPPASTAGRA